MANRQVTNQRPIAAGREIRTGQRADYRSNDVTGLPWGQVGWPSDSPDPLDIGDTMPFDPLDYADLAALKADLTYGDGLGPTGAVGDTGDFTTGQYIILGDASRANYVEPSWTAGAAA